MTTFWERDAHWVDHMFFLYFDYVIFVISRFGFEDGIRVLIAPVPGVAFKIRFKPNDCSSLITEKDHLKS